MRERERWIDGWTDRQTQIKSREKERDRERINSGIRSMMHTSSQIKGGGGSIVNTIATPLLPPSFILATGHTGGQESLAGHSF